MTRQLLTSALTCLAMTTSALANERPNILFCFADDWGRYASIYQDPERSGLNDVVNTSALDATGRNGPQ